MGIICEIMVMRLTTIDLYKVSICSHRPTADKYHRMVKELLSNLKPRAISLLGDLQEPKITASQIHFCRNHTLPDMVERVRLA